MALSDLRKLLHKNSQKRQKKDLVVTIHGFGTKTSSEMTPLKNYLTLKGYDVVSFDIYDYDNPKDTDYKKWIRRCEEQIRKALEDGRPITLLGFSMGGVIASYLASVYPIRQLILCAPAFNPIDFSKIQKIGKNIITSSGAGGSMSSDQMQAFLKIVSKYKESISHVECPTLIIHGTEDEVIQPKSSKKAYDLLPAANKRLIYLEGAKHRFLYDQIMEKTAFTLIEDMLTDRIF
ncbi:alpha/beta hydrolase [Ileibacterium valens]|uniref:Alpha/beta hydrolase n=1 Tax=Ileibacterium valens TaxID=1862668 RepID=A0A1U7NG74_9FIRM|nr:alpha/beta fold hydrolase [Ileibacterium valens]OLU38700.1 alpha/beta hydrolase [Erysipelotrichaceae bacterium NYU-BL-F16]OLU39905.1 alpha/beta hydrolase [Ileibacterium valens]OLU41499.1 alpha/beta hydrolase [Erysipelotrichaceae bacterium NYU-BL-E8]